MVVVGVPDDRIAPLCSELAGRVAFHRGQWALHLSGSVGLDALGPAHLLGAEILALHPLQSFPSLEEGISRLPGSAMAVTALDEEGFAQGADRAERLVARARTDHAHHVGRFPSARRQASQLRWHLVRLPVADLDADSFRPGWIPDGADGQWISESRSKAPRTQGYRIAVRARNRHGIADRKNLGITGHGQIGLNLQAMGAVGGLLHVRSAPGEGTTVEGRLPVEARGRGARSVLGV